MKREHFIKVVEDSLDSLPKEFRSLPRTEQQRRGRCLMRVTLSVAILLSLTLIGVGQEKAASQAPAPTERQPGHEMQRLTNMLVGRWSITQLFEPRDGMPKRLVGQGTEVWRPGPGALSLIEELQTRVGDREFSGLGVIWWDTQAQGYRVIWCGSANPRGCVVMSKLAHWEGDQFVVGDEFERDGRKVVYREVFSEATPDSFTQTIYEGQSGGELQRTLTIHAAKVARAAPADPNHG